MSTRNISWGVGGKGVQCVDLTTFPTSCADFHEIRSLNLLELPGIFQACTGIAVTLPYYNLHWFLCSEWVPNVQLFRLLPLLPMPLLTTCMSLWLLALQACRDHASMTLSITKKEQWWKLPAVQISPTLTDSTPNGLILDTRTNIARSRYCHTPTTCY